MNQPARYLSPNLNSLQIATVAALVAVAGCATSAPDVPAIPTSTIGTVSIQGVGQEILAHDKIAEKNTIAANTDLVWGVLGGVFDQLGIPVTTTDTWTMTVGNAGFEARRIDGVRMNTYLDCGTNFSGPLANHYAVTLSVITTLAKVDGDHTEVSTVVDGSAMPRSNAGHPVQCTTREKLEALIVKKVEEALGLES